MEQKFRRPRGHGDAALLNAARTFAKDAAPLKAVFIEHELPPDFIERLNKGIADLEQANATQASEKNEQAAATAALDAAMEKVIEAIETLDAIVPNRLSKLGEDSPLLAEHGKLRGETLPPERKQRQQQRRPRLARVRRSAQGRFAPRGR